MPSNSENILEQIEEISEKITETNKFTRSQKGLVDDITRAIEYEEENEFENLISNVEDDDVFIKTSEDYKKIKNDLDKLNKLNLEQVKVLNEIKGLILKSLN
ncbi:MAG: hypothetical protein ACOX01_02605 [Methanobrevibacter boviskoreani]|jgi:hypothetical protein|uniref:hypothetical protein n=1 Tax=Methanobrevibacter TaxID=2172 RepID=UPI00033485F7|nr:MULTISPECIES: hypothetical protein [Methanobrevibacter]AGN16573.1 hypothetical protein Abm4_0680 [Methanobrevibacter sp. AbM4]MCI6774874.1 hypothetical protein [Methanobrevibacter boviskoreani]MCI6931303.1 hypothetical protein [Methanobrevibacter boviskoreani]MDD6257546.1 hypothetical protein [Methanobrevibacter boviskoreani]MDY5614663.1 hypothetical protein [Methanobrevibacter boviskoreani]